MIERLEDMEHHQLDLVTRTYTGKVAPGLRQAPIQLMVSALICQTCTLS